MAKLDSSIKYWSDKIGRNYLGNSKKKLLGLHHGDWDNRKKALKQKVMCALKQDRCSMIRQSSWWERGNGHSFALVSQ